MTYVPVVGFSANLYLTPLRDVGLARRAAGIENRFKKATGNNDIFYRINLRAMHQMKEWAADNLRTSIRENGRPDIRTRTAAATRLEDAVMDDKYHEVTSRSIAMMVRKKVYPDVPYYRAIEFGSDSQVGKERNFLYLSARGGVNSKNYATDPARIFNREQVPLPFRNSRTDRLSQVNASIGERSDRIVGPRERDRRKDTTKAFKGTFHRIVIRNPIKPYLYITKASRSFRKNDNELYRQYIREEADSFLTQYGIKLL